MTSPRRVGIVTGASGAIGSAVVADLSAQGMALCAADLAKPQRDDADDAILRCTLDVSDPNSIAEMVERTLDAYGRVDVIVNVAGVVSFGSARTLSLEEWDRVMAINLRGVFLCCQAVMAPMISQGYGRIVNIGSVLGKNGGNPRPWIDREEQNRAANVAYGISKAGVHAMTLYLAKELAADGITVNAVAPGVVASPLTTNFPAALKNLIPAGRVAEPSEVAAAVTFLASETSGFITGEVLDVNGGMWCD